MEGILTHPQSLIHLILMTLLGLTLALGAAVVTFKVFDRMSPYDTWREIQQNGQVGLFTGLLILGVCIGCFLMVGRVIGYG